MTTAVEINHLTKTYGDVRAVDDISLNISPGEIFGFLGLNGAGKTTTIRALLGMIAPTSGSLSVLGQPVTHANRGLWKRVGYLVESPTAYPDLTVRENLEIARRLHQLPSRTVVEETIQKLDIQSYADRKARTLSTGNMQRLGLARAILHRPDLLILDEPTSGLDPAGVVEIRNMLADLAHQQGVTIFMSSHILTEVDQLATRIGIIHQGRILEDLDKASMAKFRTQQLEVQVRNFKRAFQVLNDFGYSPAANHQEDTIIIADSRAVETPEEIAVLLVNQDVPPVKLAVRQQNLEEHFMKITGASS